MIDIDFDASIDLARSISMEMSQEDIVQLSGQSEELTDDLLYHLVQLGHEMVAKRGIEGLKSYTHQLGLCGCMGPKYGRPFCNCTMYRLLAKYLDVVVNNLDRFEYVPIIEEPIIGMPTTELQQWLMDRK
jgi:hypothetical protein